MRKKIILIGLLMTIMIFFTGCWGMVEINDRIFPYSLGLDTVKDSHKYNITITYPNINGIGKNSTQSQRVFAITSTASSMNEGSRELTTRLPYSIYYKHLKVLVLGKDFAKNSLAVRQILDNVNRDVVINKKLKLLFTETTAEDLLKFAPKAIRQEAIEGILNRLLLENSNTSAYTTQTLNKFISETEFNGVSIMPMASHDEQDIKVHGGAIFKNFEYIGSIDEKENRAVSMMRGQLDRDVIYAPYGKIGVSFLVSKSTLKKKIKNEDGNLSLDLKITVAGALQEYILEYDGYEELNNEVLGKIEKAIEDVLIKEAKETLNKIQKEYKADVIYIGEYIYKFHPEIWNQVKDKWEEVFSEMDINLDIEVAIRRIGLTY